MEFEIIYRVVTIVMSIVIALILFFKKRKVSILETKEKKDKEKLTENKTNQINQEKELKHMAKFLCDKCGVATEVREACKFDEFDLCPTCYAEKMDGIKKLESAAIEIQELEARLEALKARVTNSVTVTASDIMSTDTEPASEPAPIPHVDA